MIKCGECGGVWYGSKVWHSTDKYCKVIYRFNHKFDGDKKCSTPHLTEDEIKKRFIQAAKELLSKKDELIENTKIMMGSFCSTTEMERQQRNLVDEMDILVSRTQRYRQKKLKEAMLL